MPLPAQSSFRSLDEPASDPFKISFLKGPKRKRLAKVRMLLYGQRHHLFTSCVDIQ